MKKQVLILALSAWVWAVPGFAAATTQGDAGAQSGVSAAGALTDGEVRKVDKDAGKITIRHGAIVNLDMPPMTMVFKVSDPTLLDTVQAGDQIRFAAEKLEGGYTVTLLQKRN